MPWQVILTLLALAAIGWWLWRRLDARAAELGLNAFEATAGEQPPSAPSRDAAAAGPAAPAATDAPPSSGPASPPEQG
ncbi:MAG: hypothetical protein HY330_01330 [Chloroflexi bacterium]|nr:hypothetical protein [Chloroflexota bacterium]